MAESIEITETLNEMIEWLLKPFKKRMKLKSLVGRWLLFLSAGLVVMGAIQFFAKYDFSEADTLTSETGVGCDKIAMLVLIVLPPVEELVFRIAPYHYLGKIGTGGNRKNNTGRNAAFVGSIIWAGLHLFGRNFAVVGFQMVMGVFYFKLVAGGMYKESILFHEAFNFVPLLTCFLF